MVGRHPNFKVGGSHGSTIKGWVANKGSNRADSRYADRLQSVSRWLWQGAISRGRCPPIPVRKTATGHQRRPRAIRGGDYRQSASPSPSKILCLESTREIAQRGWQTPFLSPANKLKLPTTAIENYKQKRPKRLSPVMKPRLVGGSIFRHLNVYRGHVSSPAAAHTPMTEHPMARVAAADRPIQSPAANNRSLKQRGSLSWRPLIRFSSHLACLECRN
jgi:hypothetical protein